MARNTCRDCGQPIAWDKTEGRYIPVEPGTDRRHICQKDQTCEDCGAEFKGADWMKVCPECYRTGAKGGGEEAPAKAEKRPREPLKPGAPDDADPF